MSGLVLGSLTWCVDSHAYLPSWGPEQTRLPCPVQAPAGPCCGVYPYQGFQMGSLLRGWAHWGESKPGARSGGFSA